MTGSITQSLEDWKRGEDTGATELERRFRAYLLAVVRKNRGSRWRPKIDSQDVANEAIFKFLAGVRDGKFKDLPSRREIRKLLATIAKRILASELRKAGADKRDARREVVWDLDSLKAAPNLEVCAQWMAETVRDEHENAMEILERSLAGHSNTDIATQLAMGVRTVQKVKQRMLERILRELNDDDDRTATCNGAP